MFLYYYNSNKTTVRSVNTINLLNNMSLKDDPEYESDYSSYESDYSSYESN